MKFSKSQRGKKNWIRLNILTLRIKLKKNKIKNIIREKKENENFLEFVFQFESFEIS